MVRGPISELIGCMAGRLGMTPAMTMPLCVLLISYYTRITYYRGHPTLWRTANFKMYVKKLLRDKKNLVKRTSAWWNRIRPSHPYTRLWWITFNYKVYREHIESFSGRSLGISGLQQKFYKPFKLTYADVKRFDPWKVIFSNAHTYNVLIYDSSGHSRLWDEILFYF
jgi:hypothetical protein